MSFQKLANNPFFFVKTQACFVLFCSFKSFLYPRDLGTRLRVRLSCDMHVQSGPVARQPCMSQRDIICRPHSCVFGGFLFIFLSFSSSTHFLRNSMIS